MTEEKENIENSSKEEENLEKKEGKSNETVTFKKETLWKTSTFVLAAVLLLVVVFGVLPGNGTTGNVVANQPSAVPGAPTPGVKVDVEIGDSPIKGDKNAPVTIVEFSDYECPFCARFYSQTLSQIQKEYIDNGKVKLVFKDFPLGFHQNAQKAAEAARCARDQGGDEKYYLMHDKLFELGVVGGVDSFKQYAKDLGLDSSKFDSCLTSGKYGEDVKKDMSYGSTIGVRGTPAFFINGNLVSGAQPFQVFQQAIDAEL